MKYLYFIFFGFVYSSIRLLEFYDAVPFNWLSFYLTDLCAMPLVFGVLLLVMSLVKKNKRYLPIWFVVGMTAYWCIYFEYYLPSTNSKFTGDWLDVLMYSLGSISFILWQIKYQGLVLLNKQTQQI